MHRNCHNQQGAWRSLRESFFRPAYQSAAQEPSSYRRMSSSSTLFGPVSPNPHSAFQIQICALAPARKVPSGYTLGGAKARSLSPQTAAGKAYLRPQFALNVGGYRPAAAQSPGCPQKHQSRRVCSGNGP
ncbi:hypothetical protein AMECASPLE_029383 [Ameca splendens]|uniref:Uncharacterized protein n=1 Tax=Ameca splendens TaxID=208324 RepID=A0ABV0ZQM3_9TELE